MFKLNTEEKNRILNLHESVKKVTISEQTKNYTIKDIQTWLNTNKQSGLVVDGKIGPKTIGAITSVLGIQTTGGVQTPTGTQKVEGGVQTPAGAQVQSDTKKVDGATVATTDEPVDSLTV
jgi:hypothetical protein